MKRTIKESVENDELAKRFGFEEGELWGKDCYYLPIDYSEFVGWLTCWSDYEISLALSCRTGEEENGYDINRAIATYIQNAIEEGDADNIPVSLSNVPVEQLAEAITELVSGDLCADIECGIGGVIELWFDEEIAGAEHKNWECLDDYSPTEIALCIPKTDIYAFLTQVLGSGFEDTDADNYALVDALSRSFGDNYAHREFVRMILDEEVPHIVENSNERYFEWADVEEALAKSHGYDVQCRIEERLYHKNKPYGRNIKMTENRNTKRGHRRITEAKANNHGKLLFTSSVFDYTDQEIEDWYAYIHDDDEQAGWINASMTEMEEELREYITDIEWGNFRDELHEALDGKKLVCIGTRYDQLSWKNGDGGDVVEGVDGVFELLGDWDDVRFYSDNGLLYAEESDHDGHMGFYIKALTPKGEDIYDCWAYGYDDDEEISEMVSNLSERELHRLLFDNDEYSKTVLTSDGYLVESRKPSHCRPSRRISESRNITHRRALREGNGEYYTEKTANGYDVCQLYIGDKDGRVYAICERRHNGSYGVAVRYDIEDGQWAQGYYNFLTFSEAEDWLFDNYDYARIRRTTASELIELTEKGKLRNGMICENSYNEHYRRHYTRKPVVESRRPISRPQSRYTRTRHN